MLCIRLALLFFLLLATSILIVWCKSKGNRGDFLKPTNGPIQSRSSGYMNLIPVEIESEKPIDIVEPILNSHSCYETTANKFYKDTKNQRLNCCGWMVVITSLFICFITLCFSASLFAITSASSVQLDGELKLEGLHDTVKISWNEFDVPHIKSQNEYDMFFAQGVVHAKLRLWQMEFQRLVTAGKMSSVVGKPALVIDKAIRTLNFPNAASALYENFKGDLKVAVDAYTDGINAYLDTDPNLPLEFHLLNHKPEKWRPEDVAAYTILMSFTLSGNLQNELERYRLLAVNGLTPERIMELLPIYDLSHFPTVLSKEDSHLPSDAKDSLEVQGIESTETLSWLNSLKRSNSNRSTSSSASTSNLDNPSRRQLHHQEYEYGDIDESVHGSNVFIKFLNNFQFQLTIFSRVYNVFFSEASSFAGVDNYESLLLRGKQGGASNNWVISGKFTKSGKPLLMNDPHLDLSAPSVWVLNHIEAPSYNAIGASFPGCPFVVIGRNEKIAWGITNIPADTQDTYVLNEVNSTHYLVDGETLAYTTREERMEVHGEDGFTFTIRESVFGPVISDDMYPELGARNGLSPLSLHWISTSNNPLYNVTTHTFEDASCIGNVPLAIYKVGSASNWDEFSDAVKFWGSTSQSLVYADVDNNIGYRASGLAVNRVAGHSGRWPMPGDTMKYFWNEFIKYEDMPHVLNPSKGFIASANNRITPPGFPHVVTNDWDEASTGYRALRITQMIQSFINSNHQITIEDNIDIQMDYTSISDIGSKEALLWNYFMIELSRVPMQETNRIWIEDSLLGYLVNTFNVTEATPISKQDKACSIQVGSCLDYASGAFNKAVEKMEYREASGESTSWGSDNIGYAKFTHAVLDLTPLACLASPHTAHGGDQSSPNVHVHHEDMVMSHGPSYRHIVDLNEMESSLYVNPPGQNGDILSSNYRSMLSHWSEGRYLPMSMRGDTAAMSLVLKPGKDIV